MSESSPQKVATAKKLLDLHKLPLDAATLSNALVLAGLMEVKKYLSSTGSGEEKSFLRFTEVGESFGKNTHNPFHDLKTEPKFYEDQFLALYVIAVTALYDHSQRISKP